MDSMFSSEFGGAAKCKASLCKTKAEPVTSGIFLRNKALGSIELGIGKLSRALLSTSWSFMIPTIKEQISLTLSTATVGSLTIEEDGESATFGCPTDGGPHVRLTVLSQQFWVRLMLVQDLGFAEAYMAGEIA
ncbi:hypothetical protein H4R26_005145, partial [Coemansia thaxteri]